MMTHPELSHYVYRSGDTLVNLTTQKRLGVDATEEELRTHLFLKGQEAEALDRALFGKPAPRQLSLKLTPTWQCNLRCTHCFVLDKLTKKQIGHIDVDQLAIFARNYLEYFKESVTKVFCCLVGGEISLEVEKCLEITEALYNVCQEKGVEDHFSLTTNGTVLNLKLLELFSRCKVFTISLDGVAELHNAQRKPVSDDLRGKDVYKVVTENIQKLVKLGFRDKLGVQAALYDYEDTEMLRRFYADLIKLGVRPERIKVGAVAPTKQRPDVSESFKDHLVNYIFQSPCCNWRLGEEFALDTNNMLYCDYYLSPDNTVIGKLTDPIPVILESHKALIKKKMNALQDEKCLACPVIGACWGRCAYVSKVHKPSDVCDQAGLIKSVQEKASSGELLTILP